MTELRQPFGPCAVNRYSGYRAHTPRIADKWLYGGSITRGLSGFYAAPFKTLRVGSERWRVFKQK